MPHHSTTSSRIVAPAHQSSMASTPNLAITPKTAQHHIIALHQDASWYQHIKVTWHQHQAPTTTHHNTATPHHSTTSSRIVVPAHQSNMA
ncbi:TPA: hypothetical protein OYE06_001318 [Staphylococcus aureus]|uniref:hypothetical protein n=1 Tax=Staphylococcus aureus TaxID=1280 RepID=UPI0018A1EBA5|nr:hypothetical protein [Staphylococcus aureus]MBO8797859.1 hypothetical protein [Staphylococcus aureus]MCB8265625.1 hypothetical protein [Staphylococcus aureus]MCB8273655.1 hypothetical protein [Staphylococcus aureus]HBC9199659.1 hypothetical protein [Staphylococcus aureus]HBI8787195.1 hypothetical protein [Staphylococcus aureus]